LRTENGGRTWQRIKINSHQSGKDNHIP
jgi:photosystem II stability/assembly factor-like uncharacterized protein